MGCSALSQVSCCEDTFMMLFIKDKNQLPTVDPVITWCLEIQLSAPVLELFARAQDEEVNCWAKSFPYGKAECSLKFRPSIVKGND